MPQALTNTNISATYKGVLHCNGTTIPVTGQEIVSDGTGVVSALRVGRLNQGATVSGALSATDVYAGQLRMPTVDNNIVNQVVCRGTVPGTLVLKNIADLITGNDEDNTTASLPDGVYYNPKITVRDGVIVGIENKPAVNMLTATETLINSGVLPAAQGGNYTVNWSNKPGYTADVRYAIITVKLSIASTYLIFNNKLSKDGEVIGETIISTNITSIEEYLDDNIYTYTDQQIVRLPAINPINSQRPDSSFNYTSTILRRNNKTFSGRSNNHSVLVTLNGWII